jgi:hypothetical protein
MKIREEVMSELEHANIKTKVTYQSIPASGKSFHHRDDYMLLRRVDLMLAITLQVRTDSH